VKDLSAIVLVGGRGERLKELTNKKSKPYVSFFGKYRIIDFPLSSLSFSNVKDISLLTQYEPYELMKYIGSGDDWDLNYSNEGITYMTPYLSKENEMSYQKGTADALLTQIENIKKIKSDYILILSGDQIYEIDFNECLKEHIKNNASLTIITKDLDKEKEDLTRFGIVEYDDDFRITGFIEKPENPKTNHISLGMYIFNKELLLKYLPLASKLVDFGSDLIPYIINNNEKVYACKHDGFFMDLGTIESLYQGNMFFLDNDNLINERGSIFKVYSKTFDYPPTYIGSNTAVVKSIISQGSVIYGSIKHSIISLNVRIGDGSKVKDSVILPNVTIGKNVKLKKVIVDEFTEIKDDTILEFDEVTVITNNYFKD